MEHIPGFPRWSTWGVRPEMMNALRANIAMAAQLASERPAVEAFGRQEEQKTAGSVAVITLRGLITPQPSFISLLFGGGGGLQAFRANLRKALNDNEISSIVLNVDSPGGSTDLIAETAAEIRAARDVKPVTAVANTMAASAAYWLAAQADELVVTPSGEVGSVGVFALHWDESGLNETLGIDPTYVYAGKYKIEGNPNEPLSDEARAALQATVDDYYALFVNDLALGRGTSVSNAREGFGEGRLITAQRAVAMGMADRVDTLEETVSRLVDGDSDSRGARASKVTPPAAAAEETSTETEEGSPPPNSAEAETAEVDEEAAARTRRRAVDLLLS